MKAHLVSTLVAMVALPAYADLLPDAHTLLAACKRNLYGGEACEAYADGVLSTSAAFLLTMRQGEVDRGEIADMQRRIPKLEVLTGDAYLKHLVRINRQTQDELHALLSK
jgi:hypothetical protein